MVLSPGAVGFLTATGLIDRTDYRAGPAFGTSNFCIFDDSQPDKCLPALFLPEEKGLDKGIEIAVENRLDIAHLIIGTMILDQTIRLQDI